MAEQPLLSELCTVCYVHPPKYRCPAHPQARTCSLACSKKHKSRASCNGARDPGAYLKKSQIATPAGIDHDYNFLSGVERAFDRAERSAQEKGVQVHDARKTWVNDGSAMAKYLSANGIVVDRAPKGMSRERANKSQWNSKKKSIIWTVEFIEPDHAPTTLQCRESVALRDLYRSVLANNQRQGTKRKWNEVREDMIRSAGSAVRARADDAPRPFVKAESETRTMREALDASASALEVPLSDVPEPGSPVDVAAAVAASTSDTHVASDGLDEVPIKLENGSTLELQRSSPRFDKPGTP
ncbi:Box C/D snoRNA accumulation, partial [Elasticomyces elasticus]